MAFPKRSAGSLIKQAAGFILLLSLAGVFLLSGWSKVQTIEPFAWSFLDILPVNVTTASIIAHLFIGLEWLIGLWLLAHLYLRRFTYKATIALLVLLSLYLGGMILLQGNKGNCGCFGEWLYMKPADAIWKNVAMIVGVVILYLIYPSRPYRKQGYVALFLAVAAFTAPFVVDPVRIYDPGTAVREPIDLRPIDSFGTPKPSIDLKRGKHILCFFSTTCPHCIKGAYLVQILHRRNPELPLFIVLNGTPALEKSFLAESKSGDVPRTLLSNTRAFTSMAGEYVPAIYWVNNGVIERKSHYSELEPGAIEAWLKR